MATTVYEVAVELGRPTPVSGSAQDLQWSQWITRTYNLIRERLGNLALLDQETLDDVVLVSVAAHARNPDGVDSYTVSVDDGSDTKRYQHSHGRIVVSAESWERLSSRSERGAFTIRAGYAPDHGRR